MHVALQSNHTPHYRPQTTTAAGEHGGALVGGRGRGCRSTMPAGVHSLSGWSICLRRVSGAAVVPSKLSRRVSITPGAWTRVRMVEGESPRSRESTRSDRGGGITRWRRSARGWGSASASRVLARSRAWGGRRAGVTTWAVALLLNSSTEAMPSRPVSASISRVSHLFLRPLHRRCSTQGEASRTFQLSASVDPPRLRYTHDR